MKMRLILFVIFLVLVSAWNMALSSRRQFFSGELVRAWRDDVLLTAQCPGRIEPRVQETIRSVIRGKKKKVHVKEADVVQKGDLLIEISDEEIVKELNQKQIAHGNALTDMRKAQKDYTLGKSLYKEGAIPRREVEDAKETFTRAKQNLEKAEEEWAQTKKKAAGVQVFSPLSGIVGKDFVMDRDDIAEGQELIRVAQVNELILRGAVDELDIAQIKSGQEASIVCDAFPDKKIPGRVNRIGAQAKDGSFGEIEVVIDILDSMGLDLKPNLSCEAGIVTGNLTSSVVIPVAAVRYGSTGPYVLKTRPGGWLESCPIKIIPISGWRAVVTEGLNIGEVVLVPKKQ